jgi:hypothetical protein
LSTNVDSAHAPHADTAAAGTGVASVSSLGLVPEVLCNALRLVISVRELGDLDGLRKLASSVAGVGPVVRDGRREVGVGGVHEIHALGNCSPALGGVLLEDACRDTRSSALMKHRKIMSEEHTNGVLVTTVQVVCMTLNPGSLEHRQHV